MVSLTYEDNVVHEYCGEFDGCVSLRLVGFPPRRTLIFLDHVVSYVFFVMTRSAETSASTHGGTYRSSPAGKTMMDSRCARACVDAVRALSFHLSMRHVGRVSTAAVPHILRMAVICPPKISFVVTFI